jgi:terpene synthase-like protein
MSMAQKRMSDITLEPGTQFVRPEIVSRIPLRFHPRSDLLQETANSWARPYLIDYFGDEIIADRYLAQGETMWGAMCYPDTGPDQEFPLMNVIYPITMIDDAFSKPDVQGDIDSVRSLHQQFSAVLDGEPAPLEFVAGRMLQDALELMRPHATARVYQRCRDANRPALDSIVEEAIGRQNDVIPDFGTYTTVRQSNIWGPWCLVHIEYSLGIDLTDELATGESPLREAGRMVIQHLTLVNDLHSFHKEYWEREAFNSVWIFMAYDDLTLQQAIDKLAALIGSTEREFLALWESILTTDSRPEIRGYLSGLGNLLRGNIHHHQSSSRYHGDSSRYGPLTGPVTIGRLSTIYPER